MKLLSVATAVLILSFYVSCSPSSKRVLGGSNKVSETKYPGMSSSASFFEQLFERSGVKFDSIKKHTADWNVQLIYTQIDRRANGEPRLTTYTYNEQPTYFYPASTIKLPIAALALQKLRELKQYGVDRNSTMITEAARQWETPVYNDPTSADGRPTVEHYIKKIFLVSDNEASNRLYEFLGQEYVNGQLHKKGYTEAEILHRVGIFFTPDQNRYTNPVKFYDTSGRLLYDQPAAYNTTIYQKREEKLGIGYMSNGSLVNTPMDFSTKNRIALSSLHNMITGLIFPRSVKAASRFNITEEDRLFLLRYMSMLPTESKIPFYDSSAYQSTYNKFLFFGTERQVVPEHIRIFNKIGNAYGELVDVSYFMDHKNNVEFFLSAAINVNTDGILNDDKYDYYSIGYPFMKDIGQAIYQYELARKKKRVPDLSPFIFSYE